MLIPLICLFLGIILCLYTVLAYRGNRLLYRFPFFKSLEGNLFFSLGFFLLAFALILGIVGYFNYINAILLRYFRILLATVGFFIVSYEIRKIVITNYSFKDLKLRLQTRTISEFKRFNRYLELLEVLVSRNLKTRYRGSFLGVYWSLLNPLIMTGLYTAVFGTTFSKYYNNSVLNYVLAAFTGLVVINFFAAATNQALVSVVGNGTLLNKIRLPMTVFPVSIIAANIFQLCVGVLPLLAIMTLINTKNLLNVVALVLPLFALIIFSTGVAFLVSSLYVFFRDLPYFYELAVFFLWVGSPIFYPAAIVPDTVKMYLGLNPMSPIIESIRQIVLSGGSPDLKLITSALLSGVIILVFGWSWFQGLKSQFMDLL
ncbi:ABC-2 type transporter [Calothrix sp. NIES-4071]|nr:ABC-2 type transporter [Calothrix sp. NIES-4071]BAZ63254.1 ABC-2 type transporter [Calothrix sp. NIES-4105]